MAIPILGNPDGNGIGRYAETTPIPALFSEYQNAGLLSVSQALNLVGPWRRLIPTVTADSGAATVSVDATGKVTCASASGVRLVFASAAYADYKVVVEVDAMSAAAYVDMSVVQANGADATSLAYQATILFAGGSTPSSGSVTNGQLGASGAARHRFEIDLANLYAAAYTTANVQASHGGAAGSAPATAWEAWEHQFAQRQYGVAIKPRGQAMTGRIHVFGMVGS